MDVEQFVNMQLDLLQKEREAELEQLQSLRDNTSPKELEKKGLCLTKLRIHDAAIGLYGRFVVQFAKGSPKKPKNLPSNTFGPGDIVSLQSLALPSSKNVESGLVVKLTDVQISVAFHTDFDYDLNEQFQISKLINDVTYRRLKSALAELKKNQSNQSQHLKYVLFGHLPLASPLQILSEDQDIWFNEKLNDCQKNAVRFALSQPDVTVLHGPPGTGKTTTVIEIILQAVKRINLKLLVCAPSNIAVDNIAQKLAKANIKVIRLGHPGRTLPEVLELTLDATLLHSDASLVVKGVREDISLLQSKIYKSKSKGEISSFKRELNQLRKELSYRENKAIKDVLTSAQVILATTSSASLEGPLKHLTEHHFDLVIIDEAAQALEASCWIPLLQGQSIRCILAGDHHQLPPTILSQEAASKGLQVTLMERVNKTMGEQVTRMLTTQYRMHKDIMKWPSDQLYGGKLVADDSVMHHLLSDLNGVTSTDDTSIPLLFIDTAGCHMTELLTSDSDSKGNEGEVDLVQDHVQSLISAGVRQGDIGVITPYNLQVELVRSRIASEFPKVEVRSVDGFQGREKEAIIISLVRSNEKGEIGFLSEDRRMNVAITRARRHLAVIGDSETVSRHPFLKSFYNYVQDHGEVRTAAHKLTSAAESDSHSALELDLANMTFANAPNFAARRSSKEIASSAKEVKQPRVAYSKASSECDAEPADDGADHAPSYLPCMSEDIQNGARVQFSVEDITEQLTSFLSQGEAVFSFPSALTARERAIVHEVAQAMGLHHESAGTGRDRHVTVSRKIDDHVNTDAMKSRQDCKEGQKEVASVLCDCCGKHIPHANKELHALRCHRDKAVKTGEMHELTNVKTKSKAKKAKAEQSKKKMTEFVEDFDTLIATFVKADTRCYFERCKKSVVTFGQKCQLCAHVFCLTHHMAEVHGCGEAVRAHAKAEARQAWYMPRPKPLKETERQHIKSKLGRKLDEMTQGRKRAEKK